MRVSRRVAEGCQGNTTQCVQMELGVVRVHIHRQRSGGEKQKNNVGEGQRFPNKKRCSGAHSRVATLIQPRFQKSIFFLKREKTKKMSQRNSP